MPNKFSSKYQLYCEKCGARFTDLNGNCPICSGQIFVSYSELSLNIRYCESIWRYIDLLPVDKGDNIITMGEGYTPLVQSQRLAQKLGLRRLYMKDETQNPTGSFVDRGISVDISKFSKRYRHFICATLGDTGASLSAYAARAGVKSTIYVPEQIDTGKLYQMLLCGSDVKIVRDYEHALMHAESHKDVRIFRENSPYYLEGIKTIAFEILEQLGWEPPDFILAPMGTGGLVTAIWKGILELETIGIIEDTPSIIGVQVKGIDTIVREFYGYNKNGPLEPSGILARDLNVANPILSKHAIKAIKESGGTAVSIQNDKIPRYIRLLSTLEGIIADPAGVIPIVALEELVASYTVLPSESIVAIITGSGLKAPEILYNIVPMTDLLERIVGVSDIARVRRIGDTKFLIMRILSEKPMHGYELRKQLQKKYGLSLTTATIYQHLHELTTYGLISKLTKKVKGRVRHYYFVTEAGSRLLNIHKQKD